MCPHLPHLPSLRFYSLLGKGTHTFVSPFTPTGKAAHLHVCGPVGANEPRFSR